MVVNPQKGKKDVMLIEIQYFSAIISNEHDIYILDSE